MNRQPRYCKACGYLLNGIDGPHCPECGHHYDPNDSRTYSTRDSMIWTILRLARKVWSIPELRFSIIFSCLLIGLVSWGSWHLRIHNAKGVEAYVAMMSESPPIWKNLALRQIDFGDAVKTVVMETKPVEVISHPPYQTINYTKDWTQGVTLVAHNSKLIQARAWGEGWSFTFFDELDETMTYKNEYRYSLDGRRSSLMIYAARKGIVTPGQPIEQVTAFLRPRHIVSHGNYDILVYMLSPEWSFDCLGVYAKDGRVVDVAGYNGCSGSYSFLLDMKDFTEIDHGSPVDNRSMQLIGN